MVQNPIPAAAAAEVTMMILGHQHHSTDPEHHLDLPMTDRISREEMMTCHLMMMVLTDLTAHVDQEDQADLEDQAVREVQGIRKAQVLGSKL